jgi:putative MFS transporter
MYATIYFVGILLASIPVAWLGDRYGRKPVFMISIGVEVICVLMILCSNSKSLTYFCMFVIGICNIGVYNVGYLLNCEFLTEKQLLMISSIDVMCYSIMNAFIVFFFSYISNNYLYLGALSFLLVATSFIGTLTIHETPIWLLKVGKVTEA